MVSRSYYPYLLSVENVSVQGKCNFEYIEVVISFQLINMQQRSFSSCLTKDCVFPLDIIAALAVTSRQTNKGVIMVCGRNAQLMKGPMSIVNRIYGWLFYKRCESQLYLNCRVTYQRLIIFCHFSMTFHFASHQII